MSFDSIGAIRNCMSDLELHPASERTYTLRVRISNHQMASQKGEIAATFNCNWHSGDGPYLDFGDEIKSFGIKYTQFKPQWLTMRWDGQKQQLEVIGKDYGFTLSF